MAFKRTSFGALKTNKRESFESKYKFRKKVTGFKEGSDVYVIPLGLDQYFFESPCHKVEPHKVEDQTVGFGGGGYATTIKCKGYDEYGNKIDSLCCRLAAAERARCGEEYNKRIISSSSSRVHLPILILGNSLADKTKISYPVSKVTILKDLNTEAGLNFSYLDMATSIFMKNIVKAYGEQLKNENLINYDLEEGSEEFFEEVRKNLITTVIKIHGVAQKGFSVALQDYSFFPFKNEAIAAASPDGEREALIHYMDNAQIMSKVGDFLELFNVEVDGLTRDWKDDELQEYYNSAIGLDISPVAKEEPVEEEVVEEIQKPVQPAPKPVAKPAPAQAPVKAVETPKTKHISDDELDGILDNPFGDEEVSEEASSDELDNYEFDLDEDFFE